MFLIREYKVILSKKDYRIIPMREFEEIEISSSKKKSFVVVVLTHNARPFIEDNFQSIVEQRYPHYRIVYLDKGSTDGTVKRLQQLKAKAPKEKEIEILCEEKEAQFFKAYYQLIHSCANEEIIIHLHGTDWLAHSEVFTSLNRTYSNPDVWLSYGQYLNYPDYKQGRYRPMPKKNAYRKKVQRAPWMRAYLKTFYAGLFKSIEFKGVKHESYFLSLKSEKDFLTPLAEMGKSHVQFIPDVLSVHYQVFKRKKRKLLFTLGGLKKSADLANELFEEKKEAQNRCADVILFSKGDVEQLRSYLKSFCHHISGVQHIQIIDPVLKVSKLDRDALQQQFPLVEFKTSPHLSIIDFKQLVLDLLIGKEGSAAYVLFATDQACVKETIDLTACILAMQKTRAYGFYLNFTPFSKEKEVYSWVIGKKGRRNDFPHPLEMGLYQKIDLERDFKEMPFTDRMSLVELWIKGLPQGRLALQL